ncbi:MAG: hypothetical protein AAFW76_00995 [Pseudomonadota bacterium]
MSSAFSIGFAPLLPLALLGGLAAVALIIALYGIFRGAAGSVLRLAAIALVASILANPSLVREQQQSVDDVAFIVVDRSASQTMAGRQETTDAVVDSLTDRLARLEGVEIRVIEVTQESEDHTALYNALETAQSEVTSNRLAGSFMVTDGQVHDIPETIPSSLADKGPVHTVLTGAPGESERLISILESPAFGLVGDEIAITVRIDDMPGDAAGGTDVPLTIGLPDGGQQETVLRTGIPREFTFEIDRGGPSVFEFSAAELPGEISTDNNRAAVTVNGVRDRLRVLLVSGEPHPGERTWRNILKSDPSVDLVHFTILRPPEKQDGTPISELSLIAFPIRELFELRLSEFDLIIFDRYRRRGVLPNLYLANIANFVTEGGAFLEASGPPFATPLSIYRTALGEVLPAEPTGSVIEESFVPTLTEIGGRHPVTADLTSADARSTPGWGRWLRQIDVAPTSGNIVMAGHSERPLLILDRVGEGRVAQLASDHIWLWARGYEGGGPQGELLRRLAHWLMREPELEENDLRNSVEGSLVEIERRSLDGSTPDLTVTFPSGEERTLELTEQPDGRVTARFETEELGVHRVTDGERSTLALVGDLNARELSDLRADPTLMAPLTAATGGGLAWALDRSGDGLSEQALPRLREVLPERDSSGDGWFGVRRNQTKTTVGVSDTPLLPALLSVLIALIGMMAVWRREGR